MIQALLRNRIFFLGMEGWNYIYIRIKGTKVVVTELDSHQAKELIMKFRTIDSDEYADRNERLGDIYVNGNFKRYVNSHPKIKNIIFQILDTYDEY